MKFEHKPGFILKPQGTEKSFFNVKTFVFLSFHFVSLLFDKTAGTAVFSPLRLTLLVLLKGL
jgi:hypothetical protein